jgi:hypothetical protein
VPTISFFYGIAIRMYYSDHAPPHFEAVYAEYAASVAIATGEVTVGQLPATAARLVKEWAMAHRGELDDNWRRARSNQPLQRIAGLDARQGQ